MSDGSSSSVRKVADQQRKSAHPTFHFISGLASGLSSAVLLQPVDLLKTRVQQSRSHDFLPVLKSILSSPNPVAGLWRGTVPSSLRTGFGSALYFTTLSSLRQLVDNSAALRTKQGTNVADGLTRDTSQLSSSVLPKLSNTQNLLTGATARLLAGFILMPMTVIKVRYESDLYAYRSIADASKTIFRSEGLRGFFSGFGATAVRDAPYAGLYVVFYEASKTKLSRTLSMTTDLGSGLVSLPSSTATASVNATSGVIAAGLATAITNPFDAVKTRLQLVPSKYGNAFGAAKVMLQEEGWKCFFDGLGLRMGRKAFSSALAWTVYEELIGRAERQFTDDDTVKRAL